MDRIAIVGPPKSGKTTLANAHEAYGYTIICTDQWKHLTWSAQPLAAMAALVEAGRKVVIEGMLVPRLLKHGLDVDMIILLPKPHEPLTPEQRKIWNNVKEGILCSQS